MLTEFLSCTLTYRYCRQLTVLTNEDIDKLSQVGTLLMINHILNTPKESNDNFLPQEIGEIFLAGITHPKSSIRRLSDVNYAKDANKVRGVPLKTYNPENNWNAESLYRETWIETEGGEIYKHTGRLDRKYGDRWDFPPNDIIRAQYILASGDVLAGAPNPLLADFQPAETLETPLFEEDRRNLKKPSILSKVKVDASKMWNKLKKNNDEPQ